MGKMEHCFLGLAVITATTFVYFAATGQDLPALANGLLSINSMTMVRVEFLTRQLALNARTAPPTVESKA